MEKQEQGHLDTVTLTLPDGKERAVPSGTLARDVVASIGPRLLKDAIAPRGQMADPAALSAVADAAEHGRIVLREISPGIGPLTR